MIFDDSTSGMVFATLAVLASYLLLYVDPLVRSRPHLLSVCWACLTLRHAVSIGYAFSPAFSMRIIQGFVIGDNLAFHETATKGLPGEHFIQYLTALYDAFGPSMYLGQSLGILAFSLSVQVLIRVLVYLRQDRHMLFSVVLYSILPASVIHGALLLREPYQGLFFLSGTLSAIRLRRRGTPTDIAILILSIAALIYLHQAMAVFVAAFGLSILFWSLRGESVQTRTAAVLALAALPLLSLPAFKALQARSAAFRMLTSKGGGLQASQEYRQYVTGARSDYGVTLHTESLAGLAWSGPTLIVMYMFAPMPWQVRSPKDLYALLEALLRLGLLWGTWRALQERSGSEREDLLQLLWAYILLEGMWAAGTTNWGQAIRHHLPAFGALVALGSPHLYELLSTNSAQRALWQRRHLRLAREAEASSAPVLLH